MLKRDTPPAERVLSRTQMTDSGCWVWQGATNGKGYGVIRAHGQQMSVTRIVYEATIGPVADNHELDHLCMVRSCVNPGHLEAVTHRENVQRARGMRALAGYAPERIPEVIQREIARVAAQRGVVA